MKPRWLERKVLIALREGRLDLSKRRSRIYGQDQFFRLIKFDAANGRGAQYIRNCASAANVSLGLATANGKR